MRFDLLLLVSALATATAHMCGTITPNANGGSHPVFCLGEGELLDKNNGSYNVATSFTGQEIINANVFANNEQGCYETCVHQVVTVESSSIHDDLVGFGWNDPETGPADQVCRCYRQQDASAPIETHGATDTSRKDEFGHAYGIGYVDWGPVSGACYVGTGGPDNNNYQRDFAVGYHTAQECAPKCAGVADVVGFSSNGFECICWTGLTNEGPITRTTGDSIIEDNLKYAHTYNFGDCALTSTPTKAPSTRPSVSVKPSGSSEPSSSVAPSSSFNPTSSSAPSVSANPSISYKPSSSSSASPSSSYKPSSSAAPSNSFNPTSSSAPSVSAKPSASYNPTSSTAPSRSFNPSSSFAPSSSANPSISYNPTSSTAPSNSFSPTSSSAPSSSEKPSSSYKPSSSAAPSTTSNPTSSSAPSLSANPSSSYKPSSSAAPSTVLSARPSVSEKPSDSNKPSLPVPQCRSVAPSVDGESHPVVCLGEGELLDKSGGSYNVATLNTGLGLNNAGFTNDEQGCYEWCVDQVGAGNIHIDLVGFGWYDPRTSPADQVCRCYRQHDTSAPIETHGTIDPANPEFGHAYAIGYLPEAPLSGASYVGPGKTDDTAYTATPATSPTPADGWTAQDCADECSGVADAMGFSSNPFECICWTGGPDPIDGTTGDTTIEDTLRYGNTYAFVTQCADPLTPVNGGDPLYYLGEGELLDKDSNSYDTTETTFTGAELVAASGGITNDVQGCYDHCYDQVVTTGGSLVYTDLVGISFLEDTTPNPSLNLCTCYRQRNGRRSSALQVETSGAVNSGYAAMFGCVYCIGCQSSKPSSQPSTQFSEKPSDQPSGMPSVQPSSPPSANPTGQPSCTPSIAPTRKNPERLHLFYPDWTPGRDQGCKNDGHNPAYMDANPSWYFHSSIEDCCATYFDWRYNDCVGDLPSSCARALWYPNFEGDNEGCISDGFEPQYMTDNHVWYMFSRKEDCCAEHYGWNYDECMQGRLANIAGLYYPDFDDHANICKSDNKQPNYMTVSPGVWMHDNLADCCSANYLWNWDNCMGQARPWKQSYVPNPAASPATSPTASRGGYWYADWLGYGHACSNDGNEPEYMTRSPSVWMFEDQRSCCSQNFQWNFDECMNVRVGK